MMHSKHIPIDLIVKILTRLPAKALIKFTSVSKSWYALIKNPNFISTHLNHNTRSYPNYYILAVSRNTCSLISEYTFMEHDKFEIPFDSHSSNFQLLGSCNGLVCLACTISCQYTREVFLWNPSIRKFKNLGPSDLISRRSLGNRFKDYQGTDVFLGFGFREDVNDYRVVRIVYFKDNGEMVLGKVQPEVEVYSLVSNSWRRIEAVIPCLVRDVSVTFCNGALHWLGSDNNLREWSILSFDLHDEVFGEIVLPPIRIDSSLSAKVMELNGMLALFTYSHIAGCSVWSMRKYGVIDSWTRHFSFCSEYIVASPFGFTKSSIFIYEDDSKTLRLFDPDNFQPGCLECGGPYTVDVAFVESLLLLLDEGNAPLGIEF